MTKQFLQNPTYEAALIQSRAFRALNNFIKECLKNFDLTLSEWKLLGRLSEVGQMSPREISGLLFIKQPITTRLLKSLEAKGYVERKLNHGDNRRVDVCITSSGASLVVRTEGLIRQQMKRFLKDVKISQLEIYGQVLEQIAQKLR